MRHRGSGLAALVALAALGCGPAERVAAYRFADYAEAGTFVVAPGEIVPVTESTSDRLGRGWHVDGPDGVRISGRRAAFEFDAPADAPLPLHLEIRVPEAETAATGGGTQRLTLELNDERLESVALEPGWNKLEFVLPTQSLRTGRNRIRLRFPASAQRDAGEGGASAEQEAGFTASVRRLAVGPRPAAPAPVVGIDGESDAVSLSVPLNSLFEVILQVPDEATLEAELTTPDTRALVRLELLAFEEDGSATAQVLAEHEFTGVWTAAHDLSPWAGRVVAVRTWLSSEAAGLATWRRLEVTAPSGAIPAAAQPVPALAWPPADAQGRNPDVFLIILDAARADAFSPYGATRPTPALEALAADGTTYTNAYSAAPWTGQAMPSILTGRDPEAHGVDRWNRPLPETIPMLQEIVGSRGYHVVLWTQHAMYQGNASLRRGFDRFVDVGLEEPLPLDPEVVFVEDVPTFALVHYLPPHAPYAPPAPHRGAYSDWATEAYAVDDIFLNTFPRGNDPGDLSADHRRYVRDRYDENVAFADAVLGRVVELLRAQGRYDDALIIVTSDHGEGFLEHGYFLHTRFLYEEVLRVPLVIKWPFGSPAFEGRVETPVSTAQIAATVVDYMAIERRGPGFQGASLGPATFEGSVAEPALFFSTRGVANPTARPRPMAALRIGRYKLLFNPGEPRVELYDVLEDPGESADLSAERPALTRFLLQQLRLRQGLSQKLRLVDGTPEAATELDEETLRELRALGYIQ
jgi:arylsulfatase